MSRIKLTLLFCSLFFSSNHLFSQTTDSLNQNNDLRKSNLIFRPALSGTFSAEHNWYADENNYKSIAFLFNCDYLQRITTQKFKQYYQFRSAVGYMKIFDSTWIKNNDYWRISTTLTENASKRFTHTYSFKANSQFLNTQRNIYNEETDIYEKKKTASFFNPGSVTIAYGLNFAFWDDNFINFNFATIKVSTKPRYTGFTEQDEKNIGKTKNMYIYFDYGMDLTTMIYKKISENVVWENYSSYFMNGISKEQVHLDFTNRITFIFLKYMQFRFDAHVMYEPLYSTRLQYQYDFTLGVFYELRKRK